MAGCRLCTHPGSVAGWAVLGLLSARAQLSFLGGNKATEFPLGASVYFSVSGASTWLSEQQEGAEVICQKGRDELICPFPGSWASRAGVGAYTGGHLKRLNPSQGGSGPSWYREQGVCGNPDGTSPVPGPRDIYPVPTQGHPLPRPARM